MDVPETNAKVADGAEQLVEHVLKLSEANPRLAIGMLMVAAVSISKAVEM